MMLARGAQRPPHPGPLPYEGRGSAVTCALLLFFAAGCNCGKTTTMTGEGELKLTPSSLDFGQACVKPTAAGLTVRPVTKTLTLQNGGRATLDLQALKLEGGEGFSVPGDWPRSLQAGATYELPVSFLPVAPGAVTATLSFTDGNGAVSSATLTGKGAVTAPDPVVSLHCPGGRSGATAELCWDTANMQPRPNPLMWLNDTVVGASTDLRLNVGNAGCADLEVTTASIDGGAFSLDGPTSFTVPGKGVADAGEQSLRVVFKPGAPGALNGALTLTTNVPGARDVAVRLLGTGVQPSLQLCAVPAMGAMQCATPALPVACDFSAAPACTGNFLVRNSGQSTLTVEAITLVRGNTRFTLTGAPTLPATLQPSGTAGDSLNVTAQYMASAAYDSDVLEVRSNGGTLRALLRGGMPPELTVTPSPVDFGVRATGYDGTQMLELRNTGAGPLLVRSVHFGASGAPAWPMEGAGAIFTVTAPAMNTVVMPGSMVSVPVRFVDPPAGGPSGPSAFAAELVVSSDDPTWEPLGGKLVTVTGKTPCNALPVAVVTGPSNGAAGSSVTLDASSSFDAKPDGSGSCVPGVKGPVARYEWSLLSTPANAGSGVMLTPSGATAELKLGTCAPCSYVVRLAVFDDTPGGGRKSNFTDVTINAQ